MPKKNQDWNQAKALYESFTQEEKSLRDIEKLSGVPVSSMRDRAKKEGWQRGRAAQLKQETARVSLALAQETAHVRTVIEDNTEKLLEAQGLHHDGAIMLAKMAIKFASKEGTTKGALAASQALTNTAKLTGIQPFYPNSKTDVNVSIPQIIIAPDEQGL